MDKLLSPIETTAASTHQLIVWGAVTRAIDQSPIDGLSASGEFSEKLHSEQRIFRQGMRLARLAAYNSLSEKNTDAYVASILDQEPKPLREIKWLPAIGIAMALIIIMSAFVFLFDHWGA